MTLMPLPRSTFLIVLNLASALIVGAIGFGVGFAQGQLAQTVLLFTVITVAALFWFANYVAVAFEKPACHRCGWRRDGRGDGACRRAFRLGRQSRAYRGNGAASARLSHHHSYRTAVPHT